VRAWRLGARFDGWADGFDGALWDQAFHDTGLAPHFYATRERSGDEVFPWDHLSTGVDRSYLWKEYENALAGTWTPDCRSHPCTQCGVCDHRVIRPQLHDGSAVPVETSGAVSGAQRELGAFVYRLSYAKKGDMRFFGQLEVTRALARALRRAALPVAYSAGFHPHAKLSFGGALPLGMESEVEEAHVTLTAPLDAKTLMERLNQELPAGMTVLAAVPVTRRAPEAPRQRVTYRIEALPPLTAAQLARTWRRCLEERLVKKGKRHTREIPLGAVLLDLRQVGPGALEMDLLESHEVRLRPTAIVDHLAAAGREGELTYRVCKIAVQPVRGDENAGRTHRQRQGL
jgi:radical SAM-linked protein